MMNGTPFVADAQRTQGQIGPATLGKHDIIRLRGPGVFICAEVTRQYDKAGITNVALYIDGRNVMAATFEGAKNWGFTQPNPYGTVLLENGPFSTMTIGYPVPLS